MFIKLALIVALILVLTNPALAINGKCRALVMEGGGDMGAFEVGAIWGLVNGSDPSEVTWDVVSGFLLSLFSVKTFILYLRGICRIN